MAGRKKWAMAGIAVFVMALTAVFAGIGMLGNEKGEGKADLVLCLDDSGSMHSKQQERNEAAISLLKKLDEKVNFGYLYFQYNITTAMAVSNLQDAEMRKEAEDAIAGETHDEEGGNTNFGEALNYALTLIRESRDGKKKHPAVIILFTDGKNDFLDEDGHRKTEYVEEADEKTKKAALEARDMGVVIHTICLNKKDVELLQEASAATGGSYKKIASIEELPSALLAVASLYTKSSLQGGKIAMGLFILFVVAITGGAAAYYYQSFKKKEYLMDYQVDRMKEEMDQRNKREELDAHIREEQKSKQFYMDVVVTHGNAIGGRSCFDNEGRRRSGILSIGDVVMMGRNQRGEDYTYRIDEAGMELWATFDENELILRSKKLPFEIRKEGCARDQGTRTQKATIKCGQQYYIVLESKHEIGLKTMRG